MDLKETCRCGDQEGYSPHNMRRIGPVCTMGLILEQAAYFLIETSVMTLRMSLRSRNK